MPFGRHVRSFDLDCAGLGLQRDLFAGSGAPRLRTVTIGRLALWFTTDAERGPDGRPGGDRLMRIALEPGDRAPPARAPPAEEPAATEPPATGLSPVPPALASAGAGAPAG